MNGVDNATARFTLDMPRPLYDWIAERAASDDRSMAAVVRIALESFRSSVDGVHTADRSVTTAGSVQTGAPREQEPATASDH